MRKHHAAIVSLLLMAACEGYKEDRQEETELERNPTQEASAIDSSVAGTSIDTTTPLQPQNARALDAGSAGSDSGTAQPRR